MWMKGPVLPREGNAPCTMLCGKTGLRGQLEGPETSPGAASLPCPAAPARDSNCSSFLALLQGTTRFKDPIKTCLFSSVSTVTPRLFVGLFHE